MVIKMNKQPSQKPASSASISSTMVTNVTAGHICGNLKCLDMDSPDKLQVCTGCSTVAYCGEVCQEEDWAVHGKVCKKIKVSTWGKKKKLVSSSLLSMSERIRQQTKPVVDRGEAAKDAGGDNAIEQSDVSDNDYHDGGSSDFIPGPGAFLDTSESPVRKVVYSDTFSLLRFANISCSASSSLLDSIAVKVWQDMLMTGVGVFIPVEKETKLHVEFQLYSAAGQLMYEKMVNELYPTDIEQIGELRLPTPFKLEAHRRYVLVLKMGGVACWTGYGGTYLHCLHTEKGGVQVVFETPDQEELEEFLEVSDNNTTTNRGQLPVLFLKSVSRRNRL